MRKLFIALLLLIGVSHLLKAQTLGVKTNLLYDATATVNAGIEVGLAPKWTLDVSANYNAWDFSAGRKWRHLLVQPEARYWFCERFNGHFVGVHAHWAKFNVARVDIPLAWWKDLGERRHEGDLYGGGFTYGYQWLLGVHWNLEAAIGIGYARIIYDQYPCARCGRKLSSGKENYFGPTKAAISLIYQL